MALQSGGFRLSTLPQAAQIPYTPRALDLSPIQRAITGLQQMNEQRKAADSRERISGMILENLGVEPEDGMNATEQLAALSSLSNMPQTKEKQEDARARQILGLLPEEQRALVAGIEDPSDALAAIQGVTGLRKETVGLQTAETNLAGKQREAQEGEAAQAFRQIQIGDAALDDFQEEPFYDDLKFQVSMSDPEQRFTTAKRGKVQVIIDQLTNKPLTTATLTAFEQAVEGGDYDDREKVALYRKFAEAQTGGSKKEVKVTDDVKVTMSEPEKELYDSFNLATEGKAPVGLFGRVKKLSGTQKEKARVNFAQAIDTYGADTVSAAISRLKENDTPVNRAAFDQRFGEDMSAIILGAPTEAE